MIGLILTAHGPLWGVGVVSILTGAHARHRRIVEREQAENQVHAHAVQMESKNRELQEAHDALAEIVSSLEQANRELDEFAHVASHDLLEPVRTLVAFSELLREDLPGDLPELVITDLDHITAAARRMQKLIEDLLALSRAGRSATRLESVSLEDCVDEVLAALRLRIEETGAEVTRDALPTVVGDTTQLGQVFQNLIGNALKFTGEGRPEIALTAERHGNEWILGVRDNGIGIDPRHAESVFTPFKRLHGMTEYEGTGIGLAICKKSIERHGGRIWVESEVDRGALFRFTLPVGEAA
jgi:light-regulated signal transduction histidine kinase (bacteriophytochrome)